MKTINEIKTIVYDSQLIVKELDSFPHTYKSFLGEECFFDSTLLRLLKKKLNRSQEFGDVAKTIVPGTRFGMVIYYSFDKKYNIVIESNRIGVRIYCFFKYKSLSKFYIEVSSYYVLNEYYWEKVNKKKTFFLGNVLKWI